MAYLIHIMTLIGIYSILAQSLNLILGLGGLLSLAHIATYGIGAYVTAVGCVDLGLSTFTLIFLSAIAGASGSLIVAFTSSRLTSDYFTIATLAFHYMVSSIFINWREVTRGVMGIPGITDPEIFGVTLSSSLSLCIFVWFITLVSLILLKIIFKSYFARGLRAQAESEVAAQAIGIPTSSMRLLSLVFAGALSGVAGSLFAYFLRFIDPSSFALPEIILILTMVIIGKPGSYWGCLLATALLLLLPEGIRFIDYLQNYPGVIGPIRQLIYAGILLSSIFIFKDKLFIRQRSV